MASIEAKDGRKGKKDSKGSRRARKKREEESSGQVYPFRLLLGKAEEEPKVDPRTENVAKDAAIRVCWRYFKMMDTWRLVGLLATIGRFGKRSEDGFEIECDSGDEVRDVALEEAWSWLRGWDVEGLIGSLPYFVEMGLEDSGQYVRVKHPNGCSSVR